MSLNKFISGKSGNKKGKKSKRVKSLDLESKNMLKTESSTITPDQAEIKTLAKTEESIHRVNDIKKTNQHELNPDYENLRNFLMIDLENLSKEHLVDALIDQIHSHPTYSSNKNLVSILLDDNKSIKDIAVLLNITYYEALILVKEIKAN